MYGLALTKTAAMIHCNRITIMEMAKAAPRRIAGHTKTTVSDPFSSRYSHADHLKQSPLLEAAAKTYHQPTQTTGNCATI